MPVIELIDESREFAVEELFFSTTDRKGHIQRANSVFRRIAGYAWEELKNQPHNIIRHPDMPRIVFQLLWEYIQSGRPVVAFVKNLAHDGRYYWVLALVVPIPDGFLSVRFKPTSPFLAAVEPLYVELKAVEAKIESASNDRKAAIAASRKLLETSLHTLGFSGYGHFMQQILKGEMQSRQAKIRASTPHLLALGAARQSPTLDSLPTSATMFDKLVEVLNVLFGDLEVYVEINKGVRAKSGNVTDMSEALRVSALNGVIVVDKLGGSAAGLRPVLDWLRTLSGEITQEGVRLAASLDELVTDLDLVVFELSAAKLQIEMTAQFAHELTDHAPMVGLHNGMTEGAIGILHASSCETVERALKRLTAIKNRLETLTKAQIRLLKSSHSLRAICQKGRIEMAGIAGPGLTTVFKDVSSQLEKTAANLSGLKDVLQDLESHLIRGLADGERVEETIAQIDVHMNGTTPRQVFTHTG